jgi:transcriptional regulator with XRE-family HTH domain
MTTMSEETRKNRKLAGQYVRKMRNQSGLSQLELSKKLGLSYYTFISSVENGISAIPSDRLRDWAKALDVPLDDFTRSLLRYYDPHLFDALFGAPEPIG